MSATRTKPVKLQVNDSGSWRNVIRFDAADDAQCVAITEAAATLGRAASRATFRIAMDDALQLPLLHWTREKGWVES
ncbi:hypothetical protein SAMN05216303_102324 [Rhodoferax sp. OV413]|uniref:hypothetical protein n=1 Tax=Rhodoferax sp. OV413 TaxID=1855285 RepID=UPI00088D9FC7|nr:hypothetical protein [Rhodoferax sp. OV413]SDO77566.1 hypothetical protein SAMN05216303_102324 [Rhodoferax sp. OV413]